MSKKLNDIFLITGANNDSPFNYELEDLQLSLCPIFCLKDGDVFCYGAEGELLTSIVNTTSSFEEFNQKDFEVGAFIYRGHEGDKIESSIIFLEDEQLLFLKEKIRSYYENINKNN